MPEKYYFLFEHLQAIVIPTYRGQEKFP